MSRSNWKPENDPQIASIGDITIEMVQAVIAQTRLPLAVKGDPEKAKAFGLSMQSLALQEAHHAICEVVVEGVTISRRTGDPGPFRSTDLKKLTDEISQLHKRRDKLAACANGLPHAIALDVRDDVKTLSGTIRSLESSLRADEVQFKRDRLDDLLIAYAVAEKTGAAEAGGLLATLTAHPDRDVCNVIIEALLEPGRKRDWIIEHFGARRPGSALECFIREKLAPAYEQIFGADPGGSFNVEKSTGPFIRFAEAIFDLLGMKQSPGTIRNALHRKRP